ncbi:MAG: isoleucine--tRNA ligase [Dehalococcoidia bacterium]
MRPVSTRPDFVAMERETLAWWRERDMIGRYLRRNEASERQWSFIDGPITANNPMAVHHAWGRTYKDVYQRFHTMLGEKQRYQNGFDCQGLWIEVEVEKEHGFASKKDILGYGVDKFVQECKDRVQRFAAQITEQSIRLGYWCDWDNSYFTNSDENNYTIWLFLKRCWERGWVYKGHDVMPWCPRCATGISEHEIVTEGYKELTHASVYVKFPIEGRPGESLLVWTTTPWTLAGNVAAAVHPELTYVKVQQGDDVLYVSKGAAKAALSGAYETLAELKGAELVGLAYRGPFDELDAQRGVEHSVVAWGEVSEEEGTGIVHIAAGCGKEDFALSKEHGLAVIAPTDEEGVYVEGFGFLTGNYVSDDATRAAIFDSLREKGVLYRTHDYAHRYPVCWRCGTELIFRLVDEWFISMDELRHQIAEVTRQIRWIPEFGLARELDWLKNMDDWMISKKRYYGLALPIYECGGCGAFEVIGSEAELRERAIEGWEIFAGHSPHKPFIDAVKIACRSCGEAVSRIPDVGNPWLDAGIVPFSTLHYRDDASHRDGSYWEQWYPADFITESFPGQFRNWFYSLLTMATVLEDRPSFKAVLGHALVRDEHGEEMHKSKGNAIWFDEAADRMGADVMRWMFMRHNPSHNVNFGYGSADEIRRGMFLTLWNTYAFFVTYARIDGWAPGGAPASQAAEIDRWVLSELHQLVAGVTDRLADFDAAGATKLIEAFVEDLSNWYVRRSRRRFWKSEDDADKGAAYATLYECLVTLARLMSPLVPFLCEAIYQNLVRSHDGSAAESVHLCDWPQADATKIDRALMDDTRLVMRVASLGRAARAKAQVRVRQPLAELFVKLPSRGEEEAIERLAPQVLDELNVKALRVVRDESDFLRFDVKPNLKLLGQKYGRDVQEIAKALASMPDGDRAALVAEVQAGRSVEVAGKTLAPEELLVTAHEREGFASAEDGGVVAIVSTELTAELEQEGLAREVVHRIQNLRKDAGFEIADRIRTHFSGDEGLRTAMEGYGDYVRQETLSVELVEGEAPAGAHGEAASIDGREVTLAVARV